MTNTSGNAPLQALPLTENLLGKTEDEQMGIIAAHLTFTSDAGESIKGDQGNDGDDGTDGDDGAQGPIGETPTQAETLFLTAQGVSNTATEFDIPLPFSIVKSSDLKMFYNLETAPVGNHHITFIQSILGTTTRVFFDAALSDDNWGVRLGVFS